MNWKAFFLKFIRNLVFVTLLTMVVLGLLGYLLGGRDGFINMLSWGLALGLLGSFSIGLAMLVSAQYWGMDEHYKNHPEWVWFIKKSDDDQKPDY